jgi:large subunit ribosomal protein L4
MTLVKVKTIDLKSLEFGSKDVKIACDLELSSAKSVAYVLSWQLSKRRAGTASIKTMAEISGTTAKPHNQKGTGRARQGSKRSVQFRGGRACHGPRPRSFDYSIPKKIAKLALFDILKLKLKEDKVIIFNNAAEIGLKTAKIGKAMKDHNISSSLVIYNSDSDATALVKSVRNLKNVKALDSKAINVYDIVSFDCLLIDNQVFENINERVLQ